MQTITINVHVPRAVAVAAGHSAYGDTTYELSSEEIGELSTAELTALLRFEGAESAERLVLASYSPAPWKQIREALAEIVTDQVLVDERRAARDLAEADLKHWARGQRFFGKLQHLADLNYDVGSAYVFALAQVLANIDMQLSGLEPAIVTCTEQLDKNVTFEVRAAPSLFALTLESRARAEMTLLSQGTTAPGTLIEVPPIQRVLPKHGNRQTVLLARISHPATGYGSTVIWSAEDNRDLPGEVAELRDPGPEAD